MPVEHPLRQLPAIEKLLQHESLQRLLASLSPEILTQCARRGVAALRAEWTRHTPQNVDEASAFEQAIAFTLEEATKLLTPSLKKVINATGVILHTGLGRAVLSHAAKQAMQEVLDGYCNLEFDLATGKRGDRHQHVEKLLRELTGAEAACVVNNNAAAVLLVLNTIANKKEIVTSRGQLVEIGGSFRMPEVVKKSGARLVEIGTTNKTKLVDYANAITPRTAGFLVVHTSNYRILGFTHEVELGALAALAQERNVMLVHDLGGGVLVDLRKWGLPYEPVVAESIQAGAHLVTFSGDKVLGGPQCGLIVGKSELISKVKKNPLMRALRCDKLTLALLESTLRLFLKPSRLIAQHEIFRMLAEPLTLVQQRAEKLHALLHAACGERFDLQVVPAASEAGSGALPLEKIPSVAVALKSHSFSANTLAKKLRLAPMPVLGYVREDWLWLDARTIKEEDLAIILNSLSSVAP